MYFQITVDIKAAPPMQLLPVDNPGTPTVSNTRAANTRCVVRNLRLELRVWYMYMGQVINNYWDLCIYFKSFENRYTFQQYMWLTDLFYCTGFSNLQWSLQTFKTFVCFLLQVFCIKKVTRVTLPYNPHSFSGIGRYMFFLYGWNFYLYYKLTCVQIVLFKWFSKKN